MRLCAHSHLPPEQKATPISTFGLAWNTRRADVVYILWESESHIVGILAIGLVVVDLVLCDRVRKLKDLKMESQTQPPGRRSARRESDKANFLLGQLPFSDSATFRAAFSKCSGTWLIEHRCNGHTTFDALAITLWR